MSQLILHLVGDYIIQNDWMALNKSKRWWPAIAHVITYTIPFLLITQSWKALAVIGLTHLLIDRFSLAKYMIWAKNQVMAAKEFRYPWKDANFTGYQDTRPLWLTCWLTIVADNTLHLAINYLALRYL
jgi:hypothetical protein